MFRDREEAGEELSALLQEKEVTPDIVLAIPRGGLPLGRAVADALGCPLDIVVARKIGAPHNPELAVGAAGSDGEPWMNDELLQRMSIPEDELEEMIAETAEGAAEKEARYRDDGPPDLTGKTVLIVDDGVATGATMIACIRQVRAEGAEAVIVGVPVGPSESIDTLRTEADAVYCVDEPAFFTAVGQCYQSFEQVTDAEAISYLHPDKATEQ